MREGERERVDILCDNLLLMVSSGAITYITRYINLFINFQVNRLFDLVAVP